MKRYDRYKPTDTPWLGEIPAHWEVKRMRFICDYQKGKNPDSLSFDEEEGMKPYLSMEYIRANTTTTQYAYPSESTIICEEGDLLLLWDGSNAGEFLKSKSGILCSTCAKLFPHALNNAYYWYLVKACEEYLKDLTNGMGIPHVDGGVFKNLLMPVPPIEEQEGIVRYLDGKCGSIDKVIATQEQRITLLGELKQSIITEAVTHGLNPQAPLRPSGIDWLGNIPQHWEEKRLRFVCEFRNGYTPSKQNPDFWTEGTIPWYRMEDIRDSGRSLSEAKQYVTEEAVKGQGLFDAGSFILATTATIGEHAMLIVDSLANQQFTNLKIRKSLANAVTKEFFFYYLFLIDEFCKSSTRTATFPAMNMEDLRNFGVAIPPIQEQQEIVAHIKDKCARIDSAIAKARREIELLREYKQSVITEAVTGKIKVC